MSNSAAKLTGEFTSNQGRQTEENVSYVDNDSEINRIAWPLLGITGVMCSVTVALAILPYTSFGESIGISYKKDNTAEVSNDIESSVSAPSAQPD